MQAINAYSSSSHTEGNNTRSKRGSIQSQWSCSCQKRRHRLTHPAVLVLIGPRAVQARGKSRKDAAAMLDAGHYDMKKLEAGGWVTALRYADELEEQLAGLTGGKDDEFQSVALRKYQKGARASRPFASCWQGQVAAMGCGWPRRVLRSACYWSPGSAGCSSVRSHSWCMLCCYNTCALPDFLARANNAAVPAVSPDAFHLTGRKKIAIVREAGAITGGSKPQSGQITAAPLITKLQKLAKRKDISGIVLRVDSPGARLFIFCVAQTRAW